MKKAAHGKSNGGGPEVIRFEARLVRETESAKSGSGLVLDVPKAVCKKLRGMDKVEGTVNGHPFRAALEPDTTGGLRLSLNEAMRKGCGAGAGDTVKLAVLGPEPEPAIPADLRVAFATSQVAMTLWKELSLIGRLDWIRWIESAKSAETRARRVDRTIEQLAEGKRRPCCVNVYEYMLCRVQAKE